ncbi:hypothetical protein RND81_14G007900 [Saponaria officinalis]|uniref:Serpin domain-containing protein n=1 Tax=Saponaria officinalis TaxID=3572 RepID=A0AAW1GSQ9_SAPOF
MNKNFSNQVTKRIIRDGLATNTSTVCSPVSIDVVLGMMAFGVRNATLDELLRVLGFVGVAELDANAVRLAGVLGADEEESGLKVGWVNGLWFDKRFGGLKDEFVKGLRDVHGAEARVVDFVNQADEVVNEVNTWAEQQTNGLIKHLISNHDINAYTKVLLTNALHFKSTWLHPFYTKDTTEQNFTLINGDTVRVPFMNRFLKYYDYGMCEGCQVLRLPYRCKDPWKRFSMYIFLPKEVNGLLNLMENIDIDESLFRDQIRLEYVEITKVCIPRFELETRVSLKESMEQLGLRLPFRENCNDFSGIGDAPESLCVSDIIQKCRVESNERGTEAGVVTWSEVIVGAPLSSEVGPIHFVADHPFMFMIREDLSGVILFVGTMLGPN